MADGESSVDVVNNPVENSEHIDVSEELSGLESEVLENWTSDASEELSNLENDVVENYIPSEQEQKLIDNIDNSASFQTTETLKNYVEKKERWKAIMEFFKILWRLFSSKNDIWFNEFDNIDINSMKLDEKNTAELKTLLNVFEKKIDDTSDIKKDLKFTYVLSNIKNKILEKEYWVTDKEEQLKNSLEVWDVILLNKEVDRKDIWTKLLEAYDPNYDTDFWHAAIVIATDPIKVRHSTTETWQKSDKNWFVEEAELNSYLTKCKCKWYDLLSLRPQEEVKNKILSFSEQNLWKWYDNNAALWWWLYWIDWEWERAISWFKRNKWAKDDSFNCVEIIAQALDQEKLQDITHPNDFLEYMDIFKPVYLTTIRRF